MGENRTAKAVLGLALLAWVAYMAWPATPARRGPASLPKSFSSSSAQPVLTAYAAAAGLPVPRPRAAAFSAAEMTGAPSAPALSADERNAEWKQALAYLHGANFAAAGDAFARLASANRDNADALKGVEAARRRQSEVDLSAGGDAASLRATLLSDLAGDAEDAQAGDRPDDAVLYGNWYTQLAFEVDSQDLEKVKSIVEWGVSRKAELVKQATGAPALTFQLPEEAPADAE